MDQQESSHIKVGDTVRDPDGVVATVEGVQAGMAFVVYPGGHGLWVWRDMLEVVR